MKLLMVVVVWTLGNLVWGFLMGKYYERMAWNKLIEKGLIPKPIKETK
jgi:hypothetical protein